jgi:hypothetical protein
MCSRHLLSAVFVCTALHGRRDYRRRSRHVLVHRRRHVHHVCQINVLLLITDVRNIEVRHRRCVQPVCRLSKNCRWEIGDYSGTHVCMYVQATCRRVLNAHQLTAGVFPHAQLVHLSLFIQTVGMALLLAQAIRAHLRRPTNDKVRRTHSLIQQ